MTNCDSIFPITVDDDVDSIQGEFDFLDEIEDPLIRLINIIEMIEILRVVRTLPRSRSSSIDD